MSKTTAKPLPSAPSAGGNGAASAPASAPPPPAGAPPVETIVTLFRVMLGYQRIAGGVLLTDERGQTSDALVVDVPLAPGMDLAVKGCEAVRMAVDGLEKMRGS